MQFLRCFPALKAPAFTWTPPPAATDNGTGSGSLLSRYFEGSSGQVVPTSGEVEQYARAGDGLSATSPDFDAFFKDGTEEEEDDREEEASVEREEYPTASRADPSTGFRRGEEPLRRDYEFLRQWENGQRGGRSYDEPSMGSDTKYGEGSNYHRGGGDVHSPMGNGFRVGTQIQVVG